MENDCIVYSVQCTMYSVQCTMYSVHVRQYSLYTKDSGRIFQSVIRQAWWQRHVTDIGHSIAWDWIMDEATLWFESLLERYVKPDSRVADFHQGILDMRMKEMTEKLNVKC